MQGFLFYIFINKAGFVSLSEQSRFGSWAFSFKYLNCMNIQRKSPNAAHLARLTVGYVLNGLIYNGAYRRCHISQILQVILNRMKGRFIGFYGFGHALCWVRMIKGRGIPGRKCISVTSFCMFYEVWTRFIPWKEIHLRERWKTRRILQSYTLRVKSRIEEFRCRIKTWNKSGDGANPLRNKKKNRRRDKEREEKETKKKALKKVYLSEFPRYIRCWDCV